jgi:hypothetical protein
MVWGRIVNYCAVYLQVIYCLSLCIWECNFLSTLKQRVKEEVLHFAHFLNFVRNPKPDVTSDLRMLTNYGKLQIWCTCGKSPVVTDPYWNLPSCTQCTTLISCTNILIWSYFFILLYYRIVFLYTHHHHHHHKFL